MRSVTGKINAEKLRELRTECERWMGEINDKGLIPEEQLIQQFWPGKVQPVTAKPEVAMANGKMTVSCATEGASLGYKFSSDNVPWLGWHVYNLKTVRA